MYLSFFTVAQSIVKEFLGDILIVELLDEVRESLEDGEKHRVLTLENLIFMWKIFVLKDENISLESIQKRS